MNDLELNEALHEEFMKECWHDTLGGMTEVRTHCSKCDEWMPTIWPSYTTNPVDFWRLLQKVKDHPKFPSFIQNMSSQDEWELISWNLVSSLFRRMLDMPRGCQAIYEFFVLGRSER